MTIQDAIKSGKRFKRPHYKKFRFMDEFETLGKYEILATDWVVEEQQLTITESQLAEAWDAVARKNNYSQFSLSEFSPSYAQLKQALGFK